MSQPVDFKAEHEAGHAIAHVVLGLPFVAVELDPAPRVVAAPHPAFEGVDLNPPALQTPLEPATTPQAVLDLWRRDAIARAAGPLAQAAAFGREIQSLRLSDLAPFGGSGDSHQIERYALGLAIAEVGIESEALYAVKGSFEVSAVSEARQLVGEYAEPIRVLADELRVSRSVLAADVGQLLQAS